MTILTPFVLLDVLGYNESQGKLSYYEGIIQTFFKQGHPLRFPYLVLATLEWATFFCVLLQTLFMAFDIRDSDIQLNAQCEERHKLTRQRTEILQ